jgi:hypothetical protein
MSRYWAIIVDGVVGNIIFSDEDFVKNHSDLGQFEHVDVTDLNPIPGVTWKYDGKKFAKSEFLLPSNKDHILDDEHLEVEVK